MIYSSTATRQDTSHILPTDPTLLQIRQDALAACARFAEEEITSIEADPTMAASPFFPESALVLQPDMASPGGVTIHWDCDIERTLCRYPDRHRTWTYPGFYGVKTEGDLRAFYESEVWKAMTIDAADAVVQAKAEAIKTSRARDDSPAS